MPYFKLKCTEFDFDRGSAPDPAGVVYSTPPDPLAGFKGPNSKGREARKEGVKGQGRRRQRKGGEKGGENHTGTFFLYLEPWPGVKDRGSAGR